jgi:YHS domain-containing protein
MNIISPHIRSTLVPALLFISLIAYACSSTPHSPINVDADGVALKGYDPVAYFTMGKPVKGEARFGYDWHGARWLFASQEHMDLFKVSPEKYAPQYGGY